MGYTLPIFLIITSYVMGLLVQSLFCDNDGRMYRSCLIGTFFLLIIWETELVVFDYFGLGFGFTTRVYSAGIMLLLVLSLIFNRKKLKGLIEAERVINKTSLFVIGLCFAAEILIYYFITPDTTDDISAELVNTVLTTGSAFDYNPLTGQALETKYSLTERLSMFPVFYAYLKKLFDDVPTVTLVYKCMPLWTVFLEYCAFGLWSDLLFSEGNKKETKSIMFIGGVTALNICGAFSQKSIFYYITFKGFSPITILYAVVVPYVIYECFNACKTRRKVSLLYIGMAGAVSLILGGVREGLVAFGVPVIICGCIIGAGKLRRYIIWHR